MLLFNDSDDQDGSVSGSPLCLPDEDNKHYTNIIHMNDVPV